MVRRMALLVVVVGALALASGGALRQARSAEVPPQTAIRAAPLLSYESSPFGFLPASIGQIPNQSFAEAQDIGVRWDRTSKAMYWNEIQPDINVASLNFTLADLRATGIPAGMNVLQNIDVENRLSPVGYSQPGSYMPIDVAKYQAFVTATVERYDGDGVGDVANLQAPAKYWQVSNEIGGYSHYAQFLGLTYTAIKGACADCTVLIGGVGGMPNNYINNFNSVYLPIITALNGLYMDVFDFHWYGNATGDYRRIDEALPSIRAALDAHGFSATPIWVTEMGTYSGDPAENPQVQSWPFQTEEQQAGDLLKRYVYSQASGIKKIFSAFGLIEGWDNKNNYFNHTGLIYDGQDAFDRGNGVKKVGYYGYKLMTGKLEGSTYGQTLGGLPQYVYGYAYHRAGAADIDVIWYDDFAGGTATHDATFSIAGTSALVTNAITDQQGNITSQTLPVTGGSITLTLGQSPVFVEPAASPSVGGIAEKPDVRPIQNAQHPSHASPLPFIIAAAGLLAVLTAGVAAMAGRLRLR